MVNYPHLSRHPKNGNLYFRRGVPIDLRAAIGKREITKIFGTNVLKDVLPQYHCIATNTDRLFKEAREHLNNNQSFRLTVANRCRAAL